MPVVKKPAFDEFYSRQIVMKELGRKGQKRLAKSRVAVVGLGGLGTASSLYLTLAGVGYIRLIDQDIVDVCNLHRQVLYTLRDVDYPKVEVAKKRLLQYNPLVRVEAVSENLNAGNAERLLSGVDCVVDGLDSMRVRYLVNRACVDLKIPYVFGAAIGVEGNVSVFAPPESPCLECVFPGVEDEGLSSCDVRGVLGATVGIVGCLEAMETVKVLTGLGRALKGKFLICDFSDMYFAVVDIFKRRDCPACEGVGAVEERRERLAWLCGRDTVNVNPAVRLRLDLRDVCEKVVECGFRVRVRSRLAVIFDYRGHEVSLFGDGRMLIKGVVDEESALRVYGEVLERLGVD
jgi:adenylyltransferase/sulfurtransferase